MTFAIGPYRFPNQLVLAPMAGVTDRPFRQLCRSLGAGMTVSEMITSRPDLRASRKTRLRMDHRGEPGPIIVQIAGGVPQLMAEAAAHNVANGAQIIDINMGCPAKKVCKKLAGSALLQDEQLVARILDAVVAAVDVPVTLKIRTGSDPEHRNGARIARIAQDAGIASLAVHGRTRACRYKGVAEYETIAQIKQSISIPVIANGDITSAEKSLEVLRLTKADGLMIGRGAQGQPWIFQELKNGLCGDAKNASVAKKNLRDIMLGHLGDLHRFYGEQTGVRVARKHLTWYCDKLVNADEFRFQVVRVRSAAEQIRLTQEYFDREDGGVFLAA
jgi:tRNA-dihydrouridine synthase B